MSGLHNNSKNLKTIAMLMSLPWCLVGRALTVSVEGWGFKPSDRSRQRLKNWHLLHPWLAFTI